ncbi:MAG: type II toxin-antitoxin system Phd/YefM family antitoxin [Methylomonas sp.]
MTTYTLYNAKTHLSSLIEKAVAGEEVIIAKGKTPLVKLVTLPAVNPKREFGSMRGRARVDDAFFEPLPDEELDLWAQ